MGLKNKPCSCCGSNVLVIDKAEGCPIEGLLITYIEDNQLVTLVVCEECAKEIKELVFK